MLLLGTQFYRPVPCPVAGAISCHIFKSCQHPSTLKTIQTTYLLMHQLLAQYRGLLLQQLTTTGSHSCQHSRPMDAVINSQADAFSNTIQSWGIEFYVCTTRHNLVFVGLVLGCLDVVNDEFQNERGTLIPLATATQGSSASTRSCSNCELPDAPSNINAQPNLLPFSLQ